MEIGKSLTVRCGCVEKKQEARKILKDVQPQYKQAIVITTYSYRFKDNVEKKKPIKIIKPIKKIEKPIEIKKEIVKKKVKKIKKIINNEELNSSKIITSSFDEDKVIIIEHSEEKKVKKVKKVKKETKKVLPKEIYYIQLGSYNQAPNPRFLSIIKNNGFAYKIVVSGKTQKLRVGPYKTRKAADEALIKVRDRINKSAFIVKSDSDA